MTIQGSLSRARSELSVSPGDINSHGASEVCQTPRNEILEDEGLRKGQGRVALTEARPHPIGPHLQCWSVSEGHSGLWSRAEVWHAKLLQPLRPVEMCQVCWGPSFFQK